MSMPATEADDRFRSPGRGMTRCFTWNTGSA